MNREKFILFMDSGVGGLSILKNFLAIKVDTDIIYYADNQNFPYGNKNNGYIGELLYNIYLNLSNNYHISLISIVCNTASVSALKILREKVSIPIIGTIPAIKPAARITKKNRIGIIATSNTINLDYLPNLINKFASDKKVYIKSSEKLASIVERFYSKSEIDKILDKELSYFKNKDIDVLVLGCTHYSFLKEEISNYFKNKVIILDSIDGVTNRIIDLMKDIDYSKNHNRILFLSKSDNDASAKYQEISDKFKLFNKIIIEDLSCQKV